MAIKHIFVFCILSNSFLNKVNGKDMSSLIFVIDDTGSMFLEIADVKEGINAVLNTFLDHKSESQIDNFILVTFNDYGADLSKCTDPGIRERANTKDPNEFRKALNEIRPFGGALDCEECSMTGIKKGIELSLPKSTIYVFTDATAKDHYRFQNVKKLAMEKQCQIVFIVSGERCSCTDDDPKYQVYQNLADATHGQVFIIEKIEINKVLEYVKKTITGRRTTIFDSKLSPGFRNISFYVDALMEEVIFSFASTKPNNPHVNVKAPDGSDVPTNTVFTTEKVTVYSLNVTKPGIYTVGVKSNEKTHAVVSAKSGVDLNGFSAFNISSIDDFSIILDPVPATVVKHGYKEPVTVKTGSKASIKCDVTGVPPPRVTWLKDKNKEITRSSKFHISDDHTLSFVAQLSDAGDYVCTARNKLGTDMKSVEVFVTVPATVVKHGHKELVTVKAGSKASIKCDVTGVPPPRVIWLRDKNKEITKSSKFHISDDHTLSFVAELLDAGYYFCYVYNELASDIKLVELYVTVPAAIVNKYEEKRIIVVEGDWALLIDCNTTGYPKPIVTWTKDDKKLAAGSTYFVKNGTLTIVKIPENAGENYTCKAVNPTATDSITYEVVVEKSPPRGLPIIPPTYIERGQSAEISCPLAHKNTDLLRWYKDQVLIQTGELSITNSLLKYSGEYTCRVSTKNKSHSKTIEIVVGYAPIFRLHDYEKNIAMRDNKVPNLNCEADATPEGDYAWFYNKNKLNWTKAVYVSPARVENAGEYKCEVTNRFGNISRVFYVTEEYCVIEKTTLGKTLAPLTLDSHLTWPELIKSDRDIIKLPKGKQVIWFCPSNFNKYSEKYLTGFCGGGASFKVNGTIRDYSDIKCKEKITHKIKRTKQSCYSPNTELIKIGYDVVDSEDTVVYEICFDIIRKIPLYSKHILHKSFADDDFGKLWSDEEHFNVNFDEAYSCDAQKRTIMEKLGTYFHNEDDCCFGKRQLVSPKDVFPGVPQRSTYSYFNVVPQWSPCESNTFDNWDEIESRVRNFVRKSERDLVVWTGITEHNIIINKKPIIISKNPTMFVPLYLWKVVQDPYSNSSLAIIQVNFPDLVEAEASKYKLCTDVCGDTRWMQNEDWYDVTKGYTYCCSITEFEEIFNFKGIFEPAMDSILRTSD